MNNIWYIFRRHSNGRDSHICNCLLLGLAALSALILTAGCSALRDRYGLGSRWTDSEAGFINLFDGQSLKGWTLVNQRGDGYGVTNGVIYCARGGGGNLF